MMMYGGNANFYHLAGREYNETLELLAALAGKDTWMIPSAGPDFGKLMEAVFSFISDKELLDVYGEVIE